MQHVYVCVLLFCSVVQIIHKKSRLYQFSMLFVFLVCSIGNVGDLAKVKNILKFVFIEKKYSKKPKNVVKTTENLALRVENS